MICPAWLGYRVTFTRGPLVPSLSLRPRVSNIAARNRSMRELLPRLGLKFQPMDADGNIRPAKVAA